jgi:hypothetical protein
MNDTLRGLLKSKTFYFNIASAALEVVNQTTGIAPGAVMTLNVLGNIFLRTLTTQPLSEK